MSFVEIYNTLRLEELKAFIYSRSENDVADVLGKEKRLSEWDFMTLLSPAAGKFIEDLAACSAAITRKRFGNVIQLYIPLYLSNECTNICTYCGFSVTNKIPRIVLTREQIKKEAEAVKAYGFEHLLLVTGESSRRAGVEYLKMALEVVNPYFSNLSIEVQPLKLNEYKELREYSVHAVLVYQETYHCESYRRYHPRGKKSNFEYRLETPDRIGAAGMHKIGLGVLLGLEDWRVDAAVMAVHLRYLEQRYWRTKYSVSFPRLRPAEGVDLGTLSVTERDLLQLICALRIFDPDLELSLSTRESAYFRDHVIPLGITTVSAGSRTDPGGYSVLKKELKQFEIDDSRSPLEVAEAIKRIGLEPVWKDWDRAFGGERCGGAAAKAS
ncbi:MAG: 2-iminoacetate synthase ThiH [Candidatus Dadabacteria bacterium]|nr:MAG: 2-iminoacetate synthase ThiH [Candidatus Dadabacteria bacterium]